MEITAINPQTKVCFPDGAKKKRARRAREIISKRMSSVVGGLCPDSFSICKPHPLSRCAVELSDTGYLQMAGTTSQRRPSLWKRTLMKLSCPLNRCAAKLVDMFFFLKPMRKGSKANSGWGRTEGRQQELHGLFAGQEKGRH